MSIASVRPVPASSRHLTDVAFRFGVPETATARALPASDGAWTLDDVLCALSRGANVVETQSGLRLRHAHRRPGLAAALDTHEATVRLWIQLGLSSPNADPALRVWPERVRLYVAWLDAVLLPDASEIEIRPGVCVTDPTRFREAVQDRLDAGPDAASALGLIADLTALFQRYAQPALARPSRRRFARAA